jgi:hypothetical protein
MGVSPVGLLRIVAQEYNGKDRNQYLQPEFGRQPTQVITFLPHCAAGLTNMAQSGLHLGMTAVHHAGRLGGHVAAVLLGLKRVSILNVLPVNAP